jgi:hypothetical protein
VIARLRRGSKAPLAVAGILSMPLFFAALMAMSLAEEEPTVTHVVRNGKTVAKLGDPSGATEATIWLLAAVTVLGVALVGVGAIALGRWGIVLSALAGATAAVALLVPIGTWEAEHTARYPDGVDLIPRSAGSEDIYLRGEWEAAARHTAVQLELITLVAAGVAVAVLVMLELRRRRGRQAPAPPPPPTVLEGQAH